MAQGIKLVRPSSDSEKRTRTTVDTIELTPALVKTWQIPPFQRAFRLNRKVQEVVQQIITDGGVLPGVITLGVFEGSVYIVDGQHRVKAFEMSQLPLGYADVRQHYFTTLAEMSDEFVQLNSSLVRLRPDDILRGLEASTPVLQRLRKRCPFIGYEHIRRSGSGAVMSMSTFIRAWVGGRNESPAITVPATTAVQLLDEEEANGAIDFATLCFGAWQRDNEYAKLWSGINMMLCAWLYRRLVMGQGVSSTSRWTRYTKEDFRRALMALSSEAMYLEFLVGRNVSGRDRSPAYSRIKTIIGRRYQQDHNKKPLHPQPSWSHSGAR
jgi:hypothetical protein